MKLSEKLKDISTIQYWIKVYIEKANTLIEQLSINFDDININNALKLREEMKDFINAFQVIKKTLSGDDEREIHNLFNELKQLELDLSKQIVDTQRSQDILARMESVAIPEPSNEVEPRNYSKWGAWPLGFSEKSRSKMSSVRLPE